MVARRWGVCGCSGGCAWLLPGGACVVAPRGVGGYMVALGGWHAWLLPGGVRGCSGGACVVAPGGGVWLLPGGGMRGCSGGGHVWFFR